MCNTVQDHTQANLALEVTTLPDRHMMGKAGRGAVAVVFVDKLQRAPNARLHNAPEVIPLPRHHGDDTGLRVS